MNRLSGSSRDKVFVFSYDSMLSLRRAISKEMQLPHLTLRLRVSFPYHFRLDFRS